MPSKNQSIDTFAYNMDELIACKYVLSTKKISVLLKAISQSKLFVELFQYCLSGFDYEEEKTKYFINNPINGEKHFIMPHDKKTAIALVFSLLFEIDSKKVDFMGLLNEYFNEKDVNLAYSRFTKEVLMPFSRLVLSVANEMITEKPKTIKVEDIAPVQKAVLSDEDIYQIKALLEQSKGVILQYKIDIELKSELMCLYDYFRSALYDNDIAKIKSAYLGYKYGILFHRKNDSSIEKIAKILQKSGIL